MEMRTTQKMVCSSVMMAEQAGQLIFSFNNAPNAYTNVVIDLDDAASTAGVNLVDGFLIKFQSLDNFEITTDGYSFDDIMIFEDTTSP